MSTLDERPGGPLIPPDAPPASHLLARPTGAACDLDRTDCFFHSKGKHPHGVDVPVGEP